MGAGPTRCSSWCADWNRRQHRANHLRGHDYLLEDIRFGVRFADMLSELPDGRLRADYGKFDELVPLA